MLSVSWWKKDAFGYYASSTYCDTKTKMASETTKIFGLQWAPLNVPWRRRLQTLCVAQYLWVFLGSQFLVLFIFAYLALCTSLWWLVLLYFVWFFYDRNSPKRGGRPSKFYRKLAIWRHCADYFPMKLVKTADLDPTKNYIFGYHPHGIASLGAVFNFATDATGFDEKFPGIQMHVCTLASNFMIPFRREYVLPMGAIDVSRQSIEYVLARPEPGNAVMIVVGGAQEALDANPGSYRLVLRQRRGFIRLAMRNGADLVPVFSFGENELFVQVDNPKGSWLRRFQEAFKEKIGFSPPIFHGRGIFNYTLGLMPFRRPITAVVGKPISVERIEKPTDEQLDAMHQQYMDALTSLFEENKLKYGVPQDAKLIVN